MFRLQSTFKLFKNKAARLLTKEGLLTVSRKSDSIEKNAEETSMWQNTEVLINYTQMAAETVDL